MYNFYDSNERDLIGQNMDLDDLQTFNHIFDKQEMPTDWVMLHRQIQRELELRPDHPNIVPLVGHFVDRAPQTSSSFNEDESKLDMGNGEEVFNGYRWKNAELFSEGFGGQPLTYYMLMPRYNFYLN